jgi:hypothetical protein
MNNKRKRKKNVQEIHGVGRPVGMDTLLVMKLPFLQ